MNPSKRLLSLDVLRGITVAGMIWSTIQESAGITLPLLHMPSGMAFRRPIWYFRCLCS